jgi:hypothetical protein
MQASDKLLSEAFDLKEEARKTVFVFVRTKRHRAAFFY